MTEKIRKELKKTKTYGDFHKFLKKYYPKYFDLPVDKWEKEVYEYYVVKIIGMPLEKFEEARQFYL